MKIQSTKISRLFQRGAPLLASLALMATGCAIEELPDLADGSAAPGVGTGGSVSGDSPADPDGLNSMAGAPALDPAPVDSEPADREPADPEPVDPEPVDPEPVDPEPVDPEPVDPEPVDPEPVDPEPVDPTPVDPTPVDPTPVDPEPVVPVKVFILAGQSNMHGQGMITAEGGSATGTLDQLVADPAQSDTYGHLIDSEGNYLVRDDVYIYYDSPGDRSGYLAPGVGSGPNTIGPELQFGHLLGDHFEEPVLLIKSSWGSKSLATDFRPPSSGGTVGPYYTMMVDKVHEVLGDLGNRMPGYAGEGFEIAGFAWNQGMRDRNHATWHAEYQVNCVNLVNDIRAEFETADLPFVIAVSGLEGWIDHHPWSLGVIDAQLAVPTDPGLLNGTRVATVETRDYWRDEDLSPGVFATDWNHWNLNAASYIDIGAAMGAQMIELLSGQERSELYPVVEPPAPLIFNETPQDFSEDFSANRGTTYDTVSGDWTETQLAGEAFTDMYTEQNGRLEFAPGSKAGNKHFVVANPAIHGTEATISVTSSSSDTSGTFSVYFLYVDEDNHYRFDISHEGSRLHQVRGGKFKTIAESTVVSRHESREIVIELTGAGGIDITYFKSELDFQNVFALSVAGGFDYAGGRVALGATTRAARWDDLSVVTALP